jgi:hypothetical protein
VPIWCTIREAARVGAGFDIRWVVISGDADFFEITKIC